MAATTEESFKVCGLCSQLVDESVEMTSHMRVFLCHFLDIADFKLPAKVCLECYQKATDCRNFKERCDKAIFKLAKSAVYSAMILGGSAEEIAAATGRTVNEEKRLIEAEKKTKVLIETPSAITKTPVTAMKSKSGPASKISKPGPASKKSRMVPTPPRELLEPLGPRSTGSSAPTTPISGGLRKRGTAATPAPAPTPRTTRAAVPKTPTTQAKPNAKSSRRSTSGKRYKDNEARVIITKKDKSLAERVLKKFGPPVIEEDFVTRKRRRSEASPIITPPSGKRRRVETTSSGRVVRASKKSGFIFPSQSSDEGDTPLSPSKRAVVAKKSAPPAAAPTPKPGPKSAAAKKTAVKPKGKKQPEPEAIVISDDEDVDEIFPTVGPYQCEICQKITDTKQEFVDHIKKFHLNVVDEEVLKTLESDLRKSRKKAVRAAKLEKTPKKPASKKSVMAATGPKSSPKSGNSLSESMKKKRGAPIADRTCNICGFVLSSNLKTDHDRHQKTRKCMQVAREKGMSKDPLDTKQIESEEDRTCQFCGKVLARKKDLPGHYKTKTCVAKQYERESKQENFIDTSVKNSGEDEQQVSNTPVVMDNAELDEGEASRASPSNLPSSTTNEADILATGPITKVEQPMSPVKSAFDQLQQDPLQATTTVQDTNGGNDWLGGGPITTISDTLEAAMAGIDPLTDVTGNGGEVVDPLNHVPNSILDGLNSH